MIGPDRITGRPVTDHIYKFGTQRINWYVIEAEGRLTIVDAGLPGHWPQLVDWLAAHDYTITDIEAVLLTHADADHVGFVSRLADHGIPVYCHAGDFELLSELPHGAPDWFYRNLWRPGFVAYAVEMIRDGVTSVEPLENPVEMSDGDQLPIPGNPRVLHAPGHTPGSVAFHLQSADVVLCGDVLATRNIYTGRPSEPRVLGAADHDPEQARRSLSALEGMGEVTLLPGHGEAWRGPITLAIESAR